MGRMVLAIAMAFGLAASPDAAARSRRAKPPPEVPTEAFEVGVDLVYAAPGCPVWGMGTLHEAASLWKHFEHREGAFLPTSSGYSSLSDGLRTLMPDDSASDGTAVLRFLAAQGEPEVEVLQADLPVLISPYAIMYQTPYDGHFDWLTVVESKTVAEGGFPDLRRATARLVRYTASDGTRVRSLELPGAGPIKRDLHKWTRRFSARGQLVTPDDQVEIHSMVRPLYTGPRVRADLAALLSPSERADHSRKHPLADDVGTPEKLFVHPGGLLATDDELVDPDLCARTVEGLDLSAIVPNGSELAHGPDRLAALAAEHGLPYVAANLSRVGAKESTFFFPRFITREIAGLTVAFVGVVGPDQLENLPVSVRSQWKVDDPVLAFRRTHGALTEQLHRAPDLTVALVATERGDTYARMLNAPGADVVLGLFNAFTLLQLRESATVRPGGGGREGTRATVAIQGVRSTPFSVGRIAARFTPAAGEMPARLREIVHESWPVLEDGPVDEALAKEIRTFQEKVLPDLSRVVLPDVDPIVRRNPSLHRFAWGRVLLHQRLVELHRGFPGSFTDPLWMRFVTNILRSELGADVAISRNLPRSSHMVGPLIRWLVSGWVAVPDGIRLVTLRGSDVLRLAAHLRVLGQRTGAAAPDQVFAAGLDVAKSVVGGRPIQPKDQYLVATTDYVMGLPELAAIFGGKKVVQHFAPLPDGGFRPSADGKPLLIRDVVIGRIDRWQRPEEGGFDPARTDDFERMLLDHSHDLQGRWRLLADELSLKGAGYANTSNVDTFAASKETRVTTPSHFSIGLRTDLGAEYDGPTVAWETRLRAHLLHQEFDIPGQDIPAQEAADDLVLSTELRINAIAVGIGQTKVPLVPFLQAAYDTEFTATSNPTDTDPHATFPHQHIVRGTAGLVMSPRVILKEMRLGGVFQEDFSESTVRYDAGLMAGFKLEMPLWGSLVLSSDLDFRYLLPDDNDAASDLGLVLTSVSKLTFPITEGISLFGFADLYYVQGKVEENKELGGSRQFGVGFDFSRVLNL